MILFTGLGFFDFPFNESVDWIGWKFSVLLVCVLQMPEAPVKKTSKSASKVKTEKIVDSADKEKKVVKQKRRQKRPYGRLYARAVFTGFRRGLRNQHENTALLKVDGCDSKADSWFYVGKRVAYVYRVWLLIVNSKICIILGRQLQKI